MKCKDFIKSAIQITDTMVGDERIIRNPLDYRYALVHKIIDYLKRACVYYDPESKDYFDNMEVIIVDSPTVNAVSTMGGMIVVYSGIIDYYKQQKEAGQIANVEEVKYASLFLNYSLSLPFSLMNSVIHLLGILLKVP